MRKTYKDIDFQYFIMSKDRELPNDFLIFLKNNNLSKFELVKYISTLSENLKNDALEQHLQDHYKLSRKRILVACEESQAVTIELRLLGHEAYSCDIISCSGGHPEWHLQQDVLPLLKEYWDMIITFPPCTHLAVSGARHFEQKRKDGRQQQGINFFMEFTKANSPKIVIENPIGIMSTHYRKPDQIIQPWQFGDKFQKSTCLWIKGLPKLEPTKIVEKGEFKEWIDKKTGKTKRQATWYFETLKNAKTNEERSRLRSKTFPGIAKAMAQQWS